MKAIWFRAGLLDDRLQPRDLSEIRTAVYMLKSSYGEIDKDYVWPTVLQALTALSRIEGYHQTEMRTLIDVMSSLDSDRRALTAAVGTHDDLRDALARIGASPLAYTGDCDVVDVVVDGHDAVFLYAGFTTQAPFAALQGWLDPKEWHDRAPVLFRQVQCTTKRRHDKWGVFDLWQQTFQEKATPFPNNAVLTNTLACDNATCRTPRFSITSYDLDGRHNDVLVDCGYLMIRDLGSYRAASFVKMIGFEDPAQNEMISQLKHMWVSLIRAVAEGDATNRSGGQDTPGDPTDVGDDQTSVSQLVQGWVDASTSCLQASGTLAGNLVGGFTGPKFGWDDFRRNVTGYWSDIAQHYVSALSATQGAVAQMARPDPQSVSRAKVMMGPAIATSWVAVEPTATLGAPVEFFEMRGLSDIRVSIPSSRISGRVVADGDERLLVVRVNAQGLGRGVYVGTARIGGSAKSVPTFVYVTGATVKAA
jgi:hypothetical protein